jgi:NAD(P)-dependent dehydrogenase (short-subunit alcohol dehydrogenase family)
MTQPLPLAGKTALVTGASRGLGAVIAKRLYADGAALILTARDLIPLQQLADSPGSSDRVRALAADLAIPADVERLIDFCLGQKQPVQIVVNNAAIQGPIGTFHSADFAKWQAVFQINFFAPARICQRLLPPMLKHGWGKIINLSGGGSASPRPDFSAYGASKCALVRLSETLAQEHAASGIDINCLSPGAMNTRMLQEVLDAGNSSREFAKARKQLESGGASPDQAADVVSFLASPASNGITGRMISAMWDNWRELPDHKKELSESDIYTLRRIVPEDRAKKW